MKAAGQEKLSRDLIDFPEDLDHYHRALETERMMLIATGKLFHAPYSQASVQLPKSVVEADLRISAELYYFMVNG